MFRPPPHLPRPCRLISAVSAATALALTLRRWAFDTFAVDAVYYAVHPMRISAPVWPFLLVALSGILALVAVRRLERTGEDALPCQLLWPLLLLPQTFLNLAAVLALVAWSLMRSAGGKLPARPLSRSAMRCLVILLAAFAAEWSFYLQCRAFRSLFLAYQDWGEYAECYLRLADGKVPLRAWAVQAGHFDPLPNLLMSTLFRVWRSPEAVFFVSALLLGALPVLICRLAGEYRLPRRSALLLGFAAAFSPVLINQSLSLFYGYHPVLFQGVLIVGFFIFERRKCRSGMAAMLLLSLLVQETAAVLWFGYALYLASCKRFRIGAALAVSCIVYFVLVSRVVMPFAAGGADNPQLFHYSQLGGSLGEVVLSPFLRPRAFWGTALQKQNLLFAAALLLPCGALALLAPRRLLIVLPLFAGVALQGSVEVKNPAMQYGFEITVVLLCSTVAASGKMLELRTEHFKRVLRAGVRTVAAMSLLCALCWSRLPVGKYSAEHIFKYPDMTEQIEALRGYSAPGDRVLTTKRLRLYHMFDRRVAPPDAEWRTNDTIVLDLADPMEPVERIRRRLLDDPRAVPCHPPWGVPSDLVVWKIAASPRPPWRFVRRIDEAEFRRIGRELQQDDPAFEARVTRTRDGRLLLLVRLKKKVGYDILVELNLLRNGAKEYRAVGFGSIYPAWYAEPGDTFLMPIDGEVPSAIQLAITPRK